MTVSHTGLGDMAVPRPALFCGAGQRICGTRGWLLHLAEHCRYLGKLL